MTEMGRLKGSSRAYLVRSTRLATEKKGARPRRESGHNRSAPNGRRGHHELGRVPTQAGVGSATKRSGKGSPVAKGAPADFVSWKARAAADLKRQHNVNPGIIPARMWKHLYIQGHSSQRGAELAAVSAYNAQSAADRLRKR
jgi:hypothetical protein